MNEKLGKQVVFVVPGVAAVVVVVGAAVVAAAVVVDAVTRLLPGAIGHEQGAADDSFATGMLEGPQYTRPPEFRGMRVPEVLLSGDHGEVAKWHALASRPSGRVRFRLVQTSADRESLL